MLYREYKSGWPLVILGRTVKGEVRVGNEIYINL